MIEWFHRQNEYERIMSLYDFERLQERLGMYIVILLGIFILVVLPLCIWSINKWCCKVNSNQGTRTELYSVAVSNQITKDDEAPKEDPPCLNCKLIEMGSMTCEVGECGRCGKSGSDIYHRC